MLFNSFIGPTVKEFDDICDKGIQKNAAGMRWAVYPKEKTVGNDP
jgi:hypothetical protein